MPVQNDMEARIQNENAAPVPPGAAGGGIPSAYSLLLLAIVLLEWYWVKIYSKWILFADIAGQRLAEPVPDAGRPTPETQAGDFQAWWNDLHDDHKRVMLQVTAEHIANPRTRTLVRELVENGALMFRPGLRPRPEWEPNLRVVLWAERKRLAEWERPEGAGGWSYSRWVILLVLAAISIFLLVTQPNLPAQLGGWVSATTVAITTVRKWLDSFSGKSAG